MYVWNTDKVEEHPELNCCIMRVEDVFTPENTICFTDEISAYVKENEEIIKENKELSFNCERWKTAYETSRKHNDELQQEIKELKPKLKDMEAYTRALELEVAIKSNTIDFLTQRCARLAAELDFYNDDEEDEED